MSMTRGEAIVTGFEQVKEGLAMVGQAGGGDRMLAELVGNKAAVKSFRQALGQPILRQLVYTMVASRQRRVGFESVSAILDTFFQVLEELAEPYEEPEEGG